MDGREKSIQSRAADVCNASVGIKRYGIFTFLCARAKADSLPLHHTIIVCSVPFWYSFILSSDPVQCLFSACSVPVQCLFIAISIHFHLRLTADSNRVYYLITAYSDVSYCLLIEICNIHSQCSQHRGRSSFLSASTLVYEAYQIAV